MHLLEYNRDWLDHDGKTVKIRGLTYRLAVKTYLQKYPYKAQVITVHAEPVNKRSKEYLYVKGQLGDDWSTDILASDFDVQFDVLKQLQGLN